MTPRARAALPGVMPFRVDADGAAYLVGERSADAFRARVAAGLYPPGQRVGNRLLWRTRELQGAVDPAALRAQDGAAPAEGDFGLMLDRSEREDDRSAPARDQAR